MAEARGKASAKTILIGEHYVVYGVAALAVPVPSLSLEVILRHGTPEPERHELLHYGLERAQRRWQGPSPSELTVEVQSTIPLASGMGSSAALSVALARAYTSLCAVEASPEEVFSFSMEMESRAHGRPSGVDSTVITYGRGVHFRRGAKPQFWQGQGQVGVAIFHSGRPSSTREMVEKVATYRQGHPCRFEKLCQQAEETVSCFQKALEKGSAEEAGSCAHQFHQLLCEVGVSTKELNRLCETLTNAGATGAKLSGGGGGGIVLAFFPPSQKESFLEKLQKIDLSPLATLVV